MPFDGTSLLLAALLVVVNKKEIINFFEFLKFKITTKRKQKKDGDSLPN
jgi:hypothetical protein